MVTMATFTLLGTRDPVLIFCSHSAQIGHVLWICKQEKKHMEFDILRSVFGPSYVEINLIVIGYLPMRLASKWTDRILPVIAIHIHIFFRILRTYNIIFICTAGTTIVHWKKQKQIIYFCFGNQTLIYACGLFRVLSKCKHRYWISFTCKRRCKQVVRKIGYRQKIGTGHQDMQYKCNLRDTGEVGMQQEEGA